MSRRHPHRLGISAMAIASLFAASTVSAQTPTNPSVKSPATARHLEFDVGAILLTPVSMGSQNISLTGTNGAPVTVARTSSSTATSFGLEARMGFPVASRMALEVMGAWSHVSFQTEVTGDIENPTSVTASTGVSRFNVGGDVSFALTRSAKREFYAIGGASWMREVSELSAGGVFDDGVLVDAGAGLKMILREGKGRLKRMGLRVEGRLGVRSGGLTLDSKSVHLAPAFVASFLLGT